MFENITSKVTTIIRDAYRAAVAVLRKQPWIAPVAIIALLLVVP